MRFTKEDICYYNIIWFAIDTVGHIMLFDAGKYGNIPEFVCESKENAETLFDYFDKISGNRAKSTEKADGKESIDLPAFAKKGIYCFVSRDGQHHTTNYTKFLSPQKAICITELPDTIKELLARNSLDVNAENTDIITVQNAYKCDIQLKSYVTVLVHNKKVADWFLSDVLKDNPEIGSRIKNLRRILAPRKIVLIDEAKQIKEVFNQTEIYKGYFEIKTKDGEFVLYLIYKRDAVICDKGGLFSIQLYSKEKAVLDFNDKSGVWVEV